LGPNRRPRSTANLSRRRWFGRMSRPAARHAAAPDQHRPNNSSSSRSVTGCQKEARQEELAVVRVPVRNDVRDQHWADTAQPLCDASRLGKVCHLRVAGDQYAVGYAVSRNLFQGGKQSCRCLVETSLEEQGFTGSGQVECAAITRIEAQCRLEMVQCKIRLASPNPTATVPVCCDLENLYDTRLDWRTL